MHTGQELENPLDLLGQYSDDELDEESSGEQVQAVSRATSVTVEHQVIYRSYIYLKISCGS